MQLALLLGVCVLGEAGGLRRLDSHVGHAANAADSGEDDKDDTDVDIVDNDDVDQDNTGWQTVDGSDRGEGEGVDAENPETGWKKNTEKDDGIETKTVVIAVICAFCAGGLIAFLAARWYLGIDPKGHKYTGESSGPPRKEQADVPDEQKPGYVMPPIHTGDPNEKRNPDKLPHGQVDPVLVKKNSKDAPVTA